MKMSLLSDLSIDILDQNKGSKNYLSDLCDTFSLSNLISGIAGVNSLVGFSIDLMLTKRPRSFHHNSLIETGTSDCYKLIISFFRTFFNRIPAKIIEYHCVKYRNFT